MAALVVIDVLVAQTATAPRTPYDEIGVLQASRFLAGDTDVPQTLSLGYYAGAALFIAPIWWFTQDAATVYAWAVHVNILIGLVTVLPLAMLGRRLGLTTAQAVAAGAVVMLLPARTALSDYVLSEQTLAFFVAWSAVAAFAVWERPTAGRMTWFVLAVLAAYASHARALVLVLVAGIWLLLFLRRRALPALLGLAMLAVGAYGVSTVSNLLLDRLVAGGFGQGGGFVDKLTSLGGIFARVTLVQSWAQLSATLGLVAVGAILLTARTWQDAVRDKVVGPYGFLWGSAVAAALLSFVGWSSTTAHVYGTEPRFDSWTYTRYIDPFVMGVVLVALAAIATRVDRAVVAVALAGSVAVIAGTVLWAIRIVPTWGSNYGPGNNAGIYPLLRFRDLEPFQLPLLPTFTNDNRLWAFGSLVTVVALVAVLVLRAHPRLLFVLVGVGVALSSVAGDPSQTRDPPTSFARALEAVDEVSGREADVAMLLDCPGPSQRAVAANWVGFWFSDRTTELVGNVDDLSADDETVIACADWQNPTDAPRIAAPGHYGYAMFVLDPELARQLESAGTPLVDQDALQR